MAKRCAIKNYNKWRKESYEKSVKTALESLIADPEYFVADETKIILSPNEDMKVEGYRADEVEKGLKDMGISFGTRLEYDNWEGTTVTITATVSFWGKYVTVSEMVDRAK